MSKDNINEEIQNLSYDEAMKEIEELLNSMEHEQLAIDVILKRSRRVVALINHCRHCMESVSKEVDQILHNLNNNEAQ